MYDRLRSALLEQINNAYVTGMREATKNKVQADGVLLNRIIADKFNIDLVRGYATLDYLDTNPVLEHKFKKLFNIVADSFHSAALDLIDNGKEYAKVEEENESIWLKPSTQPRKVAQTGEAIAYAIVNDTVDKVVPHEYIAFLFLKPGKKLQWLYFRVNKELNRVENVQIETIEKLGKGVRLEAHLDDIPKIVEEFQKFDA